MTQSTDAIWTEVRVAVPADWSEAVATALSERPGNGSVIGPITTDRDVAPEGYEWVRTYVAPDDDTASACERLGHRLDELVAAIADPALPALRIEVGTLETKEWVGYSKRFWKSFRVGRIAIITPDWEGRLREDDVPLVLEPGRAFGTGRHATTRSCLLALQQRLRPGDRVLDCGAGSGILSVAAAKLGARECLGFDIEPSAASVSEPLSSRNGTDRTCRFLEGSFDLVDPGETYDIVLANIFWDVLERHAADIAAHVAPGGWFAASGCSVAHQENVNTALVAAGLDIETIDVRGRWATFLGRRATR